MTIYTTYHYHCISNKCIHLIPHILQFHVTHYYLHSLVINIDLLSNKDWNLKSLSYLDIGWILFSYLTLHIYLLVQSQCQMALLSYQPSHDYNALFYHKRCIFYGLLVQSTHQSNSRALHFVYVRYLLQPTISSNHIL